MIRMQRIPPGEKWHGKPGRFKWIERRDGLCMAVVVPTGRTAFLYTRRGELPDGDGKMRPDWSVPGNVDAWNGDWDAPTLTGSILAFEGTDDEWHGHIQNGMLHDG